MDKSSIRGVSNPVISGFGGRRAARVPKPPKWNRLRNIKLNNSLQRPRDHSCVLFVQHTAKNGRTRTILRRSFVACAGLFSNSERATEGGIPRSSRFRWFAKSLALSGSVRKARNG